MNYKNFNDNEILYMIKEKDDEATDIIYDKYRPIVIALANKYLNTAKKSGIEYEDLLQEGMFGLSKAIATYNENNAIFYTYATLCINGYIRNTIRAALAKKQQILNNAISLSYPNEETGKFLEETISDDNSDSVINQIEYQETVENIKKFMYTLKETEIQVFELKLNGFTNKEISELIDKTKRSVDNIVARLKNKFTLHISNS